jgi:pyridoxal phosphate enzyme (YggS family)
MGISENLALVTARVHKAEAAAGRVPGSVKLLAVSKTFSPEIISEAYTAGQRDFGENRVQEWQTKVEALPQDCRWHLIGRLQTNKVKYLDKRVACIHSLDRFSLLEKLEEEGKKKDLTWEALLQVNIAQDKAKAGLAKEEVRDFLAEAHALAHVKLRGFMTIGLWDATREENRAVFAELRRLQLTVLAEERYQEMTELSMGMSGDFEEAIIEGATIIRVGSVVFGQR